MPFAKHLALWTLCALVFFALDFLWLSLASSRLYQPALGGLLSEKPLLGVAAVFYLVYVVGIVALAVIPGAKEGHLAGAVWRGALFGLIAYATYDLTNLATIKGWPWHVSAIDLVWGTSLTGAVAAAGYAAAKWLGLGP